MPRHLLFLAFAFCAATAVGQNTSSTVPVSSIDSSLSAKKHHLDSSLTINKHQLDSSVKVCKHRLDSTKKSLTHKIDSLDHLKLPTSKYQHKLDSISRIDPLKYVKQQQARLMAAEKKLTAGITSTENTLTKKINSFSQRAEGSLPVQPGASGIPGANIPGVSVPTIALPSTALPTSSLPSLKLPNESLPSTSLPSIPNPLTQNPISKELNTVSALPQKEVAELKNDVVSSEVKKDMGDAGKLTKEASAYGKDVNGVLHGDSASMQRVSKKVEGQVTSELKKDADLKGLGSENQQLSQLKKLTGSAENPEALEKQELQTVKKQAINHFAGKEQILKNAMDEVSKLKLKYHSLNGLANIPKRIPNEMHGKPLIERIIPGVNWQIISKGHYTSMDFNPVLGYKFNPKFSAGAGWNQRVNFHHLHANTHPKYYGPRAFADYKIKGGISFRIEFEVMNTLIPPNQAVIFSDRHRQWVWNSFGGMKKNYKLFRHLNGNAQLLYNLNSLFDRHHLNLYGDALSARIGFEFPMKKGKKKVSK